MQYWKVPGHACLVELQRLPIGMGAAQFGRCSMQGVYPGAVSADQRKDQVHYVSFELPDGTSYRNRRHEMRGVSGGNILEGIDIGKRILGDMCFVLHTNLPKPDRPTQLQTLHKRWVGNTQKEDDVRTLRKRKGWLRRELQPVPGRHAAEFEPDGLRQLPARVCRHERNLRKVRGRKAANCQKGHRPHDPVQKLSRPLHRNRWRLR